MQRGEGGFLRGLESPSQMRASSWAGEQVVAGRVRGWRLNHCYDEVWEGKKGARNESGGGWC